MTPTRWCPTGNHFRKLAYFRVSTNGKRARDCRDCEEQRRLRVHAIREEARFDGVDTDAIHYKRRAARAT